MPSVGDKVEATITIQGHSVIAKIKGEVLAVNGNKVKVVLNTDDGKMAEMNVNADNLRAAAQGSSWNLPLQVNTSG